MLILPPEADDAVVASAVERITKVIGESGGTVGNVDRWGRRRFAFEIERQHEGFYLVVEFTAEPTAQLELERQLTLADEVVRFKVTLRPKQKAATSPAQA